MTIGGERGNPTPVTSVGQEYKLIRATSCPCGGKWEKVMQVMYFDPAIRKHCDRVKLLCLKCGQSREVHFDISAFFQTPSRDGRLTEPTQEG